MPQRHQSTEGFEERAAAAERAVRWLVRLSPLLDDPCPLDAVGCRERIRQFEELRTEAVSTLTGLEASGRPEEAELLTAIRQSVHELAELEQRLREHLTAVSPGDPEGALDLESLRSRLAILAAEREVGTWTRRHRGSRLELTTSPPHYGVGLFLGLFSLGWLSFTTLIASQIVADMFKTHSLAGLLQLGFCVPFCVFGVLVAYLALESLVSEGIHLERGKLVLLRRRLGITRKQEIELGHHSQAYLIHSASDGSSGQHPEIGIRNRQGEEVRFAVDSSHAEPKRLVQKINHYLRESL